jgi:G3E family GTPase
MSGATAVYLISGFLGSGKTTFLNRIIHAFPSNRKLMILMNEFGEMGVDGSLVENDDLAMLEISKGSIFCVCVKTDFIKGLMNIAQNTQPDVLIIEATGVANHDTFTSVEKQIESATVFIINKVDEADAEVVQKVKQIVRKHHPNPDFYETTYADIPLGKFLPEVIASEIQDIRKVRPVSEEALEAAIDKLLQDPGGAMTPPDRLVSGSFTWKGMDCGQFEEMMKLIPNGMVRAKGIFETSTGIYLFNWVMGRGQFEEIVQKERMASLMNQIVFIGPPEVMEQMGRIDFGGMMQHVLSSS